MSHDNKPVAEKILINEDYFLSLIKDIEKAAYSIDLETYIFSDDVLGKKIADGLMNAAKRGVKVRLLIDGAGSHEWGGKLAVALEKAGVKVRVYHPLPWLVSHWGKSHPALPLQSKIRYLFSVINRRNHRKSCIIDNDIVYVGSANIIKCHLKSKDGGNNWRDSTIRLQKGNTKPLQDAFDDAWKRFHLYGHAKLLFSKVPKNPLFRVNYSRHQRRILHIDLLRRIRTSKKRIWITNAYFMPDAILLKRLIKASEDGVDVKIIISNKSDVLVYPLVSKIFYSQLLKAGISIFEYMPSVLHTKTLIIDDWFCVGSSNLNYRSVWHDLEVDVNVRSNEAKRFLENQFLLDIAESKQIKMSDVEKIPWYLKLTGWMLLYLQYWL